MALAAAELLIIREGLVGFSMRKVAQAIGYTVGNLYLLFANQDDLLAAINERTADAIHASLQDACEPHTDARERLRAMGAGYVEFAQRHPHRFRLMFEHTLPATMQPRHTTDIRLKRLFELVETNLAPLVPALKPDALRAAAAALWSAVHGVCTLAVSGKLKWSGLADHRDLSDGVVDIFVTGLAGGGIGSTRRRRKA
ncbi:MAG TPA: TetR/AcrR family transcriptional regulator [Steroidobacteraceae bacterium]|nr:TetR/AcrR family transcriptional regulator [Steroidobacteraceae bacterium]